jgi:hypothetical protein
VKRPPLYEAGVGGTFGGVAWPVVAAVLHAVHHEREERGSYALKEVVLDLAPPNPHDPAATFRVVVEDAAKSVEPDAA